MRIYTYVSPRTLYIYSPPYPPIKIMVPPMDTADMPYLAAQSALPVESCQEAPRSLLIHTSLYLVPKTVTYIFYESLYINFSTLYIIYTHHIHHYILPSKK